MHAACMLNIGGGLIGLQIDRMSAATDFQGG
jgi:hypothetical protein